MNGNRSLSGSGGSPGSRRALTRLAMLVALCGSMAPAAANAWGMTDF